MAGVIRRDIRARIRSSRFSTDRNIFATIVFLVFRDEVGTLQLFVSYLTKFLFCFILYTRICNGHVYTVLYVHVFYLYKRSYRIIHLTWRPLYIQNGDNKLPLSRTDRQCPSGYVVTTLDCIWVKPWTSEAWGPRDYHSGTTPHTKTWNHKTHSHKKKKNDTHRTVILDGFECFVSIFPQQAFGAPTQRHLRVALGNKKSFASNQACTIRDELYQRK